MSLGSDVSLEGAGPGKATAKEVAARWRKIFEKHALALRRILGKAFRKARAHIDRRRLLAEMVEVYAEDPAFPVIAQVLLICDMDVYCLLRIFETYDAEKMYRGPVACGGNRYRENRNVIVYSGSWHTTVYSRLFSRYFGSEPTLTREATPAAQYVVFDGPFDFFGAPGAPRR